MSYENVQMVDDGWVTFPGGELDGKRPKTLCPACREQLNLVAGGIRGPRRGAGGPRPVCFQCYRAELDRDRALRTASELDTASSTRFQCGLPFEPLNKVRLDMLKAERATVRATERAGVGRFEDERRQAQIAARHALEVIALRLNVPEVSSEERGRVMASAIHAAELQLPEAWLPFVVSR